MGGKGLGARVMPMIERGMAPGASGECSAR